MTQLAFLLRGINVGTAKAVGMSDLRSALEEAGFESVRTLLRSGNVVAHTSLAAAAAGARVTEVIRAAFGIDVAVVVRTQATLARLVASDPLATVVDNPSYYVVTFFAAPPPQSVLDAFIAEVKAPDAAVVTRGRHELLLWCPAGQSRSPAALRLGKVKFPTPITARNWNTTTKLLALFD